MNATYLNRFAQIALAGMLFLASVPNAPAQQQISPGSDDLKGTWIATVTQRDCQSGQPLGSPFQSLLTFAEGGTLTESAANPAFFPDERGPGHGVWSSRGGDLYSASSIAFITDNGALAMTQVITQTIVMSNDPDKYSAIKAVVQFFDPTGKLLRSGCATAVAQRFN